MLVIVGKLQEDAEIMTGYRTSKEQKSVSFPVSTPMPNTAYTTPAQHALTGSQLPWMTAKWIGMSSTCLDDSELLACVDT